MKLLDLFCGAGGAAVGYHRAGFDEIVGVDIAPQKNYPFTFVQADALTYPLDGFDAIHASPPCQRYSQATPMAYRDRHPDLIDPVRDRLQEQGSPYVIENVANARRHLVTPLMLCGSMFGLPLWRHRFFEVWPDPILLSPRSCDHGRRPVVLHPGSNARMARLGPVAPTGSPRRASGRFEWSIAACRMAMDIDWMTRSEIDEAIPPAYTEFIGAQLLKVLR